MSFVDLTECLKPVIGWIQSSSDTIILLGAKDMKHWKEEKYSEIIMNVRYVRTIPETDTENSS